MIWLALQAARPTTHLLASKRTECVSPAIFRRRGKIFAVVMQISGDKQIQPPIAVVVAPCGAGMPCRRIVERYAGLLGNIGKRSVVIVVVEAVLAPVRHKDIGPAVVVVVRNGHAETPAVVGHAGLGRHVGERAVVVIMKQRRVGRRLLAVERIKGRAVDDINIEPAVVVVVDQPHAGALGLDDVLLLRTAHLVRPMGQSGLLRIVFEDRRAALHKAARRDRPLLLVELQRVRRTGLLAALGSRLRALSGRLLSRGSSLRAGSLSSKKGG